MKAEINEGSRIIIYGTGECGKTAYETLNNQFEIVAWTDRDEHKHGLLYYSRRVLSLDELIEGYVNSDVGVLVALDDFYNAAKELNDYGLKVIGFFSRTSLKILPWRKMTWDKIKDENPIRLYAGDINEKLLDRYRGRICLSITRSNYYSILHDITDKYPLEDNSVDSYQSEDVAEHINENIQVDVLNEIYRILKPEGYFRWSLPDYGCPYLKERSFTDEKGIVRFDPNGGGEYRNGSVVNGGHLWFPTYNKVKDIIENSHFKVYKFYRYFSADFGWYSESIDFNKGFVLRTKENDPRHIDMSIVVDCIK